mgnify:CR=1 FL=1
MKKLLLLFGALLAASCGENSLSDFGIENALDKAVDADSLQRRDGLYYQPNRSKPYSGWAKVLYRSKQAEELFEIKDGKRDGRALAWEENGKKTLEATYEDGVLDGYFEVFDDYSGDTEGVPEAQ